MPHDQSKKLNSLEICIICVCILTCTSTRNYTQFLFVFFSFSECVLAVETASSMTPFWFEIYCLWAQENFKSIILLWNGFFVSQEEIYFLNADIYAIFILFRIYFYYSWLVDNLRVNNLFVFESTESCFICFSFTKVLEKLLKINFYVIVLFFCSFFLLFSNTQVGSFI